MAMGGEFSWVMFSSLVNCDFMQLSLMMEYCNITSSMVQEQRAQETASGTKIPVAS